MTEDYWRNCADPILMLAFVRRRASGRRLRLFACACARRAWDRPDAAGRWAVEAAERFANGAAAGEELGASRTAAHEAALAATSGWGANRRHDLARFAAASAAAPDAGGAAEMASQDMLRVADEGVRRPEEEAAQVAGIRCVFGGLFHAGVIEPQWMTSTVRTLAQQVAESREFEVLPILADALQDAGCDDEVILAHCRADTAHAHGCWVVDLLRGDGRA